MDAPWPFDLRPLTPRLGAEVLGVTLAHGISDELFAAIYRAFLRHQVLLFEPQDLPPATQVAYYQTLASYNLQVQDDLRPERERNFLAIMLEVEKAHIPLPDEPPTAEERALYDSPQLR